MRIVHDPKNSKRKDVLHLFGFEGLGIYWTLIEWLYDLKGYLKKEEIDKFISFYNAKYEMTVQIVLILCETMKVKNSDGAYETIYYNYNIIRAVNAMQERARATNEVKRKVKEVEMEKLKKIPVKARTDAIKSYYAAKEQKKFVKNYLKKQKKERLDYES